MYGIKVRGYTFFKGHKHKPEVIKKLSLLLQRRKSNSGSFKKGCKVWNKGKKGVMPKPWNKDLKGMHFSPKTEFKQGLIPWNKNKKGCFQHTDEWKKEMSKRMSLENHPNWNNGASFEFYPIGWNNIFKEEIRKRDNHQCNVCGNKELKDGKKLHVHHIDYNKKNLNLNNLISLCLSCHMKTNFNRDYWYAYCKYILENY